MQVAGLSHRNSSPLRNPCIASRNVEGWRGGGGGHSDMSDIQGRKERIGKEGENVFCGTEGHGVLL